MPVPESPFAQSPLQEFTPASPRPAWVLTACGVAAVVVAGLPAVVGPKLDSAAWVAPLAWFLLALAWMAREVGWGSNQGVLDGSRVWPLLYLPGAVLVVTGLDGCVALGRTNPPGGQFLTSFTPWMLAVGESTLLVVAAVWLRDRPRAAPLDTPVETPPLKVQASTDQSVGDLFDNFDTPPSHPGRRRARSGRQGGRGRVG